MRIGLLGGVALLSGVLAAGNAAAQDPGQAASPVVSPAPTPPRVGLITVHAAAYRRLPSTVSDASVSIEVHGRDLRGTATQLGHQAQALLGYLRSQSAERLRTDGTSFDPEIQEQRGQPDRIKGYTGKVSISFRIKPEQLPFVLAGCLDNGATALGQFGSSPREDEVDAARRELVEEATRAAMAQARAVADAAGQTVAGIELAEVDPLPGTEAVTDVIQFGLDRAKQAAAARPAPPVAPIASAAGDSDISVTVVMIVRVARPG